MIVHTCKNVHSNKRQEISCRSAIRTICTPASDALDAVNNLPHVLPIFPKIARTHQDFTMRTVSEDLNFSCLRASKMRLLLSLISNSQSRQMKVTDGIRIAGDSGINKQSEYWRTSIRTPYNQHLGWHSE